MFSPGLPGDMPRLVRAEPTWNQTRSTPRPDDALPWLSLCFKPASKAAVDCRLSSQRAGHTEHSIFRTKHPGFDRIDHRTATRRWFC